MKKRNKIASKQPAVTADGSSSAKVLSDKELQPVAGGGPKTGTISVGSP